MLENLRITTEPIPGVDAAFNSPPRMNVAIRRQIDSPGSVHPLTSFEVKKGLNMCTNNMHQNSDKNG